MSSDRTVWSGGLLVYALEMVMLGFYFRDYLVANFAWIIAWKNVNTRLRLGR